MMLNIVNKSPFKNSALDDCLRVASSDQALIFIEDGVNAALGLSEQQQQCINNKNLSVYFLKADLEARGLQGKIKNSDCIVDDQGFVTLVIEHPTSQSWF